MPDVEPPWRLRDRYGNAVYMTEERWAHALESRPWLDALHGQILETVRQGRRKQDPLNPRKYKYYWPCPDLLPDYNHLVVVVLFGETLSNEGQVIPNNYVLTAWAVFIYSQG